jgi:hypothetical protein
LKLGIDIATADAERGGNALFPAPCEYESFPARERDSIYPW